MSERNHAPWCTFDHEGACPHENTVQAMREGRLPMPPSRPSQRFSRWFTDWPSTHVNAGKSVEVMPVSEHEAAVAALENSVVCKRMAFEVAEGGRKLWMERAEKSQDAARLVVDAQYRREQWGSDTEATFDRAIQGLREELGQTPRQHQTASRKGTP